MVNKVHQTLSLTCWIVLLWSWWMMWRQTKTCERCEMSFMSPNYIPVGENENSHYKIYLYKEQEVQQKQDNDGNCMAILFLHGLSGSYKQIRSIASWHSHAYPSSCAHFYTIDFKEEKSALDGRLLAPQIEYTESVLKSYLLPKYEQIILLGHSMGGIVAKKVASKMKNLKLITLATPHLGLAYYLDPHIDRLIDELKSGHVDYLSISPGHHDSLHSYFNASVVTTWLEGVWTSPDHQGILWSNSFFLAKQEDSGAEGTDGTAAVKATPKMRQSLKFSTMLTLKQFIID